MKMNIRSSLACQIQKDSENLHFETVLLIALLLIALLLIALLLIALLLIAVLVLAVLVVLVENRLEDKTN